jgi:hypothetical protein
VYTLLGYVVTKTNNLNLDVFVNYVDLCIQRRRQAELQSKLLQEEAEKRRRLEESARVAEERRLKAKVRLRMHVKPSVYTTFDIWTAS